MLQLLVVRRLDPTISGQLKMSQKNTWIYIFCHYIFWSFRYFTVVFRGPSTQGDVDVCLKDSMEFKSYCKFEEKESQDSFFLEKRNTIHLTEVKRV